MMNKEIELLAAYNPAVSIFMRFYQRGEMSYVDALEQTVIMLARQNETLITQMIAEMPGPIPVLFGGS